ncbi:DUF2784 domain-containing protein [Spongiactinospora gelatinilytica]|uniref:DUF2784 domain-containing protein n=1 Tax=Spongiactinospora gelatinilytica TaxID=2666298 RepID=A0A2W2GPE9_9ACTN|nr:DUF2784 domain-containing protein [Spongiactinospora gelatinilytica]PZG51406.1 DUF2784 domain-containing protein [Spongiactinospora gelatinilytica]
MGYRLVGDATMVVHFLFLAYMAVGGFLAWRLPRTIWAHAAVAAWGLISIATGVECPLTALENWGRNNAGLAGLAPSGFIDHYIEGMIYPEEYTTVVRWIVAALVLTSWIGYGTLSRRRAARRGPVERPSSEGLTSA